MTSEEIAEKIVTEFNSGGACLSNTEETALEGLIAAAVGNAYYDGKVEGLKIQHVAHEKIWRDALEAAGKKCDEAYEREQETVGKSKGHIQSNALGACDMAEALAIEIRAIKMGGDK